MVFHLDCKAPDQLLFRHALWHCPAFQDSIFFKTEVPVQMTRVVFLHNEAAQGTVPTCTVVMPKLSVW